MHGSMIDFRFRVKSNHGNKQVGSVIHKDGDTFLENGILVELKYVDLLNDEGAATNDIMKKRNRSGLNNGKWTP